MKIRRAIVMGAAMLAAGCLTDRDGPSAADNGAILYWELHTIETLYDGCSDAPDSPALIDAPEFEENSFFVYRISDDGSEAIAQDCTTTDGGSCSDAPQGVVLTRNPDNTYSWEPPPVDLGTLNPGCAATGIETWIFEDNGESGRLDASVNFSLRGDTCGAYEDALKERSPNGLGLDDCTVTIRAELDHFDTW